VVIARDGEAIVRRAYGAADLELGVALRPEHVFRIGSITKQFTAVAILQLVERGFLRLDDDVREHVPDLDTQGRRITVEQVLTHTSGLPNLVDLEGFDSLARQDHTADALLRLTRGQPLWFEPGTGFRYSDTGYIVLGAVIERVSGMQYGTFLERNVFRPLGMSATRYGGDAEVISGRVSGYSYDAAGPVNAGYISMTVPHGAGALVSNADDLVVWHDALAKGAILDSSLLAKAWAGRVLPDGSASGYGYGWKVCDVAGHRTVEHGGFINGFGANAIHFPDDGITVVVLVNQDADRPDAGATARRLARLIFTGDPLPRYVQLPPPARAALTGLYEIGPGATRTIFEQGDTLFSRREQGAPQALAALSETELTLHESEGAVTFSFEPGPNGHAAVVRAALRCEPINVGRR
jgi:CubicO group peptidase (beta-lactamase class C family)